VLRQIQDLKVEVVLVEIDAANPERGAAAIELLQNSTNGLAIFALGTMSQPMAIVAVMRAGACEYLDCDGGTSTLLEAFTRAHTGAYLQRVVKQNLRAHSVQCALLANHQAPRAWRLLQKSGGCSPPG